MRTARKSIEQHSCLTPDCCRDKWKEEERVVFESEEEAIIAQNILEEMLG